MTEQSTIDQIRALDLEFQRLTGREAFGHISNPTPTQTRIAFGDGTVKLGAPEALDYMNELVRLAKEDPGKLPYPFDQELTPEQDLRLRPGAKQG